MTVKYVQNVKKSLKNIPYKPKAKKQVYITPDRVWELIKETWGHDKEEFFDPCPVNPQFDGLLIPWKELNYVNPPYDKNTLELFVEKAYAAAAINGKTSIMLLPSKTDQQWFHNLIKWECEIKWIKGRLKFKNEKHNSPDPIFLVKINPLRLLHSERWDE